MSWVIFKTMRYLLPFIFCLFLTVPTFADEDSVQKIVSDYKQVEALMQSGKINQVDHRNALIKLHERAKKKIASECVKGKVTGKVYCLEPSICPTEECRVFRKIWTGFKEGSA